MGQGTRHPGPAWRGTQDSQSLGVLEAPFAHTVPSSPAGCKGGIQAQSPQPVRLPCTRGAWGRVFRASPTGPLRGKAFL